MCALCAMPRAVRKKVQLKKDRFRLFLQFGDFSYLAVKCVTCWSSGIPLRHCGASK